MNTKTHETYCNYNLTNLLIKLGFDWKDYFVAHDINEHFHWEIPLHIAQKWLREIEDIDVYIFPTTNTKRECVYQVGMKTFGREVWIPGQPSTAKYYTYEEALEAGINKALELILEKGE